MDNSLFNTVYNPDVLSCIANLSNDEVFTPPDVANQMLDLLPPELFRDPDAKFLDPACKSGVFLREIAKRLLDGLAPAIPDLQERADHIFKHQLYGIAITELTSHLSRRSLYCSKDPTGPYSVVRFPRTVEGVQGNIRYKNIRHTWRDGKCVYCGAPEEKYGGAKREGLESHAYEFIHTDSPEEILNMKFDVIISNPPYQLNTNTEERIAAKQARPIFHQFVEQSKKMNPRYLIMIIPARWYSGGIGLSSFREHMLNDAHITVLTDYINSKDCFDGVDIAGGICYFLWERDRKGPCLVTNIAGENQTTAQRRINEFGSFFIRSNKSVPILHKVIDASPEMLEHQVHSLDPFGFPTSARGRKHPFSNCVTLIHSQGVGYVSREDVRKNRHLIDMYKVTIARIVPFNGEVGIDPSKGYRAITNPRILKPGEIHTFSYMLLGTFNTREEAENFRFYMMNKLPRYLLRLTYSSMNIAKSNFIFVPEMDFTVRWTDQMLYEYFHLSEDERSLVEATIRPFDDSEISP